MAAYEDSYKSQLQGVSQQIPRDRLDGQVSAQDNMLSDTVTNLRRRPGARHAFHIPMASSDSAPIGAWTASIRDQTVLVILNAETGTLTVLDSNYVVKWTGSSSYLIASDIKDIQTTAMAGEFILVNTGIKPQLGPPSSAIVPMDRQGFFNVKVGAFSKSYRIDLTLGGQTYTAEYTTPDSTASGAATLTTPDFIANTLADRINAQTGTHTVTAFVAGPTIGLVAQVAGLNVSTPSGASYMIASNSMTLREEADLPVRMPPAADTYVVRIGQERSARFYRWSDAETAWLETGVLGSPTSLLNMPVRLTNDGSTYILDEAAYEGRLAGDADTNPNPEFITTGITGMTAYQGRLVLFAGSLVYLSASAESKRFYRSTVVSLLDNDPIGIGSSGAASAVWRYGVPFQKDLVLFSADEQGVIPGTSNALTPRTAAILPGTKYTSDMLAAPIVAGRTVLYASPRSADYFGVLELSPSTLTEGQYVSDDATPHLPKYMPKRCRFGVSSSVANMAVFGSTGDLRALTVHEYFWNGGEKVQQSWHRWTFPYDVKAALFKDNSILLLMLRNGILVAVAIDPRQSGYDTDSQRRPFLDLYTFTEVVDRALTLPDWMVQFDPAIGSKVGLAVATGPAAGTAIGYTGGLTDASFRNGTVAVGLPFRSSVVATPPMRKDYNGVKISSNKLTVTRFAVGTNNSSEYNVVVRDKNSTFPQEAVFPTLYYSSPELEIGETLEGGDSTAIVPARMLADSLVLELWTAGTGELNLVGLEFVAKYHEKIKRRRE